MKKDNDIIDAKYQFNESNDECFIGSDEFLKKLDDSIDKQEVFDRFLTYRRRMARLAAVQALYLYDFRITKQNKDGTDIFGKNTSVDPLELCQNVIYFYKNVFFTQQEYGFTRKNKKLDENFMFELVSTAISSIDEVDGFIQGHLSGNWTTAGLDYILRAIIRCAIAELLLGVKIEKAVLCSEYTNLAGNFFGPKEIGFINGIVDKLNGSVLKLHPFIDRKVVNTEIVDDE